MDLFSSLSIGKLILKNHFVRSATFEGNATEDGFPTEKTLEVYKNLALGDVGTIITSYAYITKYEQPQKFQLSINDDKFIDSYRRITDEVHKLGSKIIMQIAHGSSWGQGYPDKAKILGPSVRKHPDSGLISKEITKDEIKEVVNYFAEAALRVKKANFDGVQIHSAHSYLLAQFISPLFNKRTDEYGGPISNRARIIFEIYKAIRNKVGEEFPIWIKINSTDELDGGLTVDEFIYICIELEKLGIDCIEVSGDRWKSHKSNERAYYKDAAIKLASLVKTPVIVTGGLRSLEDILPIYESSNVKLFGFSRPFLLNPFFLKTLK